MKEHHFGPIDFFSYQRIEKLELRSSGGGDHISSATLTDRLVDDPCGIPGGGLSEFSFCIEDFYLQFLHLSMNILGHSQNHLAVAGGCAAFSWRFDFVPTRYREVVLTVSKLVDENVATHKPQKSKRGAGGYDSLHQSSDRPQLRA